MDINSNYKGIAEVMDDFIKEYMTDRPVNASFIGMHEFDMQMPDFSTEGINKTLKNMQYLLEQFKKIKEESLSNKERIDKKIAEGYLETQIWEFNSNHFQKGNPALYTGEAIFGILVLFLTKYQDDEKRYQAMSARMRELPNFFNQAKKNIEGTPEAWRDKALNDCRGAQEFLEKGLPRIIEEASLDICQFNEVILIAKKAFEDFSDYLEKEITLIGADRMASGREGFELMIRKAHFAEVDLCKYAEYADNEAKKETEYLKEHAKDFGADSEDVALGYLLDIHSSAEEYLPTFEKIWNECKILSEKNNLLTWPEFPIKYVNQFEWAKECAPYLYFLPYRAPAAFNRPEVHCYLAPPLRKNKMSEAEIENFLRNNNESVIKTNHVIHHGSIGHHVQNWNAYHQNKSTIGRFAGCDCANRPAMLSAGTMIEGWSVYSVQLMGEYGFLTPLELYAEAQGRRRACARAVVDIRLHTGIFTLEEAIDYYVVYGGMSKAGAKNEAIKNSMFPGGAFIYLYGSELIISLRETLKKKLVDKFDIGEFHDELLSYGSIPMSLIVQEFEKKYEIMIQK